MKKIALLFVPLLLVSLTGLGQATATGGAGYIYNGPVPLPETGAMFGVHLKLDAHNGFDRRQAMLDFETLVGRPMAVDREFYLWTDDFPTADDYWAAEGGRTIFFSWNSGLPNGSCHQWSDIASGVYDSDIHAKAAALKAFPYPAIFAFHHEPTTAPPDHESCGTTDDYKAAWRHVHDVFVADGVTNLTYALIMTALSYDRNKGNAYYPGDDIIDLIATDGYNWFGCPFHPGPWREPIEIFKGFHDFGVSKHKPMFIAEYGTGEDWDVPGKKAQWFSNFSDLMKTWQDIKGVSYFNVGNGGTCDRYVDSTPSSLAAYQAMGQSPYFNPPTATSAVTVADFSFTPPITKPAQGTGVKWTFNGPSDHTATDKSTMGLFDSGTQSPGGTYTFYFIGAGNYPYKCSIHPTLMKGTVKVPMVVSPSNGGQTTTFTITWAADHAPTGYVFDVQIKRPGATNWSDWLTGQTLNSSTFVPDSGAGKYSFRSRYHNTLTGGASNYSDPKSIQVS